MDKDNKSFGRFQLTWNAFLEDKPQIYEKIGYQQEKLPVATYGLETLALTKKSE